MYYVQCKIIIPLVVKNLPEQISGYATVLLDGQIDLSENRVE